MGEIVKTGLIPVSNALVYQENIRISDSTVGKYISLNDYKTFYCSGIGLDLSAPNTTSVVTQKSFLSIKDRFYQQYMNTTGKDGQFAAFLVYDNRTPTTNDISGSVLNDTTLIQVNGLTSIDSLTYSGSNPRILNVNESGNYTFTFSLQGQMVFKSDNNTKPYNTIYLKTYLNISGTEYLINDISYRQLTRGIYIYDNTPSPFIFSINYTKSLDLVQGQYAQIYSKIFVNNAVEADTKYKDLHLHAYINLKSQTMGIDFQSVSGPSQTYYTNPNNITSLNNKSINYYGNSRDTLKLIGNKLTS